MPLPLQARFLTFTITVVATVLFALALATLPYSHWLLIGFLVLGEVPSVAQIAGFAIVMCGFWLTQRR